MQTGMLLTTQASLEADWRGQLKRPLTTRDLEHNADLRISSDNPNPVYIMPVVFVLREEAEKEASDACKDRFVIERRLPRRPRFGPLLLAS